MVDKRWERNAVQHLSLPFYQNKMRIYITSKFPIDMQFWVREDLFNGDGYQNGIFHWKKFRVNQKGLWTKREVFGSTEKLENNLLGYNLADEEYQRVDSLAKCTPLQA